MTEPASIASAPRRFNSVSAGLVASAPRADVRLILSLILSLILAILLAV